MIGNNTAKPTRSN